MICQIEELEYYFEAVFDDVVESIYAEATDQSSPRRHEMIVELYRPYGYLSKLIDKLKRIQTVCHEDSMQELIKQNCPICQKNKCDSE